MDILSIRREFWDLRVVKPWGAKPMAAAKLTPFRAKVDERASRAQAGQEQKTESPPKKQCNPYEKQLQNMEGDTSLVKE